ncbi:NTP transferase domain-containing protein [Haloplanus aerogenes]|uniref:Adenosylcobinamide-phosphate guanylyltransferase n=1 Tax=Haloplanus aerogenes TaxID=660522 RepID=A0A3M0DWE2_9EURY|nr:NTP transferase domain-containing protein [Haloplanus aerogenes]AZH27140.1 cobalamin biosynthesis protein CobY [Haloplanus aerogenes]RMB23766.1 adenosylcobinamide-phosphate guanylyltransferase [Haloplanus aerogenes]
MCGGKGTRLGGAVEKPLVAVNGTPMVDRVCDALAASRVDRVYAAVSPHAPGTRAHLQSNPGITVVETPGDGYVDDLSAALDRIGRPALTVAADVPLLTTESVNRVLARAEDSLAVAVPVDLKRRLGVSVDTTFERDGRELAPTGINVVAATDDDIYVSDDARLAVNVNRPRDLQIAEALS